MQIWARMHLQKRITNAPAGRLSTPAPTMLFTKLKISSGIVAVPSVEIAASPSPPDISSAELDHGATRCFCAVPAVVNGVAAWPRLADWARDEVDGEEGETNASASTTAAMAARRKAAWTLMLEMLRGPMGAGGGSRLRRRQVVHREEEEEVGSAQERAARRAHYFSA